MISSSSSSSRSVALLGRGLRKRSCSFIDTGMVMLQLIGAGMSRELTALHDDVIVNCRHRLNEYLALQGKRTTQTCAIQAAPKTAGKKTTRDPLG